VSQADLPVERVTMTSASASGFDRASVETAAALAVRAPSIHNTQPWRWDLVADGLELRADRDRQLSVADPDGHSMLISCGATLELMQMALRAQGWRTQLHRFPDRDADEDLLARITPAGRREPGTVDLERAEAASRRRSDRRPYTQAEVPAEVIETVRAATDGDGAHVHFPVREEEKLNLAVAVSWADRIERDDAAYTAEMARWVRDASVHADGVPAAAVPRVEAGHPRRVNVPLRDFEIGITGKSLIEADIDEHPVIAVLLTESDSRLDQLRSGEAMMRFMVEAQRRGVATCPLSQAVDLVAFRARLQSLMAWQGFPQMMLRLGFPQPGDGPAVTPRRPVSEVLHVDA
jgi:nitroreductase